MPPTSSSQSSAGAGTGAEPAAVPIGPAGRRPAVLITTGAPQDDVNGTFVIARLSAFLHAVERGAHWGRSLREPVLLAPGPAGDAGRNREPAAAPARYHVRVVSPDPKLEALPQVRLYGPDDDARADACLFGLPAVVEYPPIGPERRTRLEIVLGRRGALNKAYCERLFRALVAFLLRTEVLAGDPLWEDEEDLHYFAAEDERAVQAGGGGIFIALRAPGAWVHVGEPLGHVYDSADGEIRETLPAVAAGLLGAVRRSGFVRRGDTLATIHPRGRGG